MTTVHTTMDTPVGELTLVAGDGALTAIYFRSHKGLPDASTFGERSDADFAEAKRQLTEYFAGERTGFDLPLNPKGDTFQLKVWELLRKIPYGQTRTYGELARELGDPRLAQAVGSANGRNPISIVVPCHRVVGADGSLVGYAGGIERKRFLLELEEPAEATAARLF
ncbi:methylated-DNA--[protein]-cysteine S-methyltransferase [Arthrobacter mobilis]|uniref:Methylated-DNA--protein-cysteine methyltransferase n=1 Tax=Arthrobacter mobilis TaxID=2724944 RepID=A0A7X6K650_9MICC|nr:methylated-DNA--[protein]-cysteine S-methyltransferase [Arthrobacter mobilis]NKX55149.1 methylated-DNA--[protein]-cysteine S-methyltransferase [Arthrobacter mobilis]